MCDARPQTKPERLDTRQLESQALEAAERIAMLHPDFNSLSEASDVYLSDMRLADPPGVEYPVAAVVVVRWRQDILQTVHENGVLVATNEIVRCVVTKFSIALVDGTWREVVT